MFRVLNCKPIFAHPGMSLFLRNLFRLVLSCRLSHVDSYRNAQISRRPTLGKLRNMKNVCEMSVMKPNEILNNAENVHKVNNVLNSRRIHFKT